MRILFDQEKKTRQSENKDVTIHVRLRRVYDRDCLVLFSGQEKYKVELTLCHTPVRAMGDGPGGSKQAYGVDIGQGAPLGTPWGLVVDTHG